MVRKRNLSDLLRDEAESLDPAEDSSDRSASAEQTIDVAAEAVESDGAIEPARRAQPTKADLQAIVTDLRVELEAGRDREQQLASQIAQLESDSQAQQTQIEQLQTQLEQRSNLTADLAQLQKQLQAEQAQTAQLKSELEEAKQLILKLTERNSQPEAKPTAKPASPPPRAALQARPLPQSSPPRSSAIAPVRPVMPQRPIAPNTIPKMSSENDTRLSDADIGWVD